jgi:hypothetical protein
MDNRRLIKSENSMILSQELITSVSQGLISLKEASKIKKGIDLYNSDRLLKNSGEEFTLDLYSKLPDIDTENFKHNRRILTTGIVKALEKGYISIKDYYKIRKGFFSIRRMVNSKLNIFNSTNEVKLPQKRYQDDCTLCGREYTPSCKQCNENFAFEKILNDNESKLLFKKAKSKIELKYPNKNCLISDLNFAYSKRKLECINCKEIEFVCEVCGFCEECHRKYIT